MVDSRTKKLSPFFDLIPVRKCYSLNQVYKQELHNISIKRMAIHALTPIFGKKFAELFSIVTIGTRAAIRETLLRAKEYFVK